MAATFRFRTATFTETGSCDKTERPLTELLLFEPTSNHGELVVTVAEYVAELDAPEIDINCVCPPGYAPVLVTYWKFSGFGLNVRPEFVPTLKRIGMFVGTPPALMVTVALLGPFGRPEANNDIVILVDPVTCPLAGLNVIQDTGEVV